MVLFPERAGHDLQAFQDGNAAGEHGAERSGELGDGHFPDQGSENRDLEQVIIDFGPSRIGPVVTPESQVPPDQDDREGPPVIPHHIAEVDDHLGERGKRSPHVREHLLEDRDYKNQKRSDHQQGHRQDGARVHHGPFHFPFQVHRFFDVFCQPVEDGIQNTARFPRGHEVAEQVVEDRRLLAESVGESGARLDVPFHLDQNFLEIFIILLAGEDFQALNEGKPGVDHRGELAGEDDDLLLPDSLPLQEGKALEDVFRFSLDFRRQDLLPAKLRPDGSLIAGLHLSLFDYSLAGPSLPDVHFRHISSVFPQSQSSTVVFRTSSTVVIPSLSFCSAAWRSVFIPSWIAPFLISPAEPPCRISSRISSRTGNTS